MTGSSNLNEIEFTTNYFSLDSRLRPNRQSHPLLSTSHTAIHVRGYSSSQHGLPRCSSVTPFENCIVREGAAKSTLCRRMRTEKVRIFRISIVRNRLKIFCVAWKSSHDSVPSQSIGSRIVPSLWLRIGKEVSIYSQVLLIFVLFLPKGVC